MDNLDPHIFSVLFITHTHSLQTPLPPAGPAGVVLEHSETQAESVSRGTAGRRSQIEARCCRCRNEHTGPGSIYRLSPPRCRTIH